jgi:hypothetical protein
MTAQTETSVLDTFAETFSSFTESFSEAASSLLSGSPRADAVVKELFGGGGVDPAAVAAACSANVEYFDLNLGAPLVGRDAVQAHLEKRFPAGTRFKVERVADGKESSGFTWMYQGDAAAAAPSNGLRGTTYVEIDAATGELTYLKEACEPLFKPGAATADLLKAITAKAAEEQALNGKPAPTFVAQTPRTAEGVVKYLWTEAYPKGAETSEALRLFADDIRYEDFNYEAPFLGKDNVREFLDEFDFPGIEFIPDRISEGNQGCCFTWKVTINGADGPEGVSFYEVDPSSGGKVCFIRDIPAPSIKPPPLLSLAAALNPKLRVFTPRTAEGGALASDAGSSSSLSPPEALACRKGANNCVAGTWTGAKDAKDAAATLLEVLESYPQEGQADVDGGGWKMVSSSSDGFALEFYSAGTGNLAKFLNGGKPFVDDLVIAINADGSVFFKSSSRVGDSDFGVNGKRVAFIAAALQAKGWST